MTLLNLFTDTNGPQNQQTLHKLKARFGRNVVKESHYQVSP
jgi:hypothetical protein